MTQTEMNALFTLDDPLHCPIWTFVFTDNNDTELVSGDELYGMLNLGSFNTHTIPDYDTLLFDTDVDYVEGTMYD